MLYILSGTDDFSLKEALADIKKGLGDEMMLQTNTTILDGRVVAANELAAAVATVPFLADKRLVIVNGLLERFDVKGSKGKGKTKKDDKNGFQDFSHCFSHIPPSTVVVLTETAVNSRNPLFKELLSVGKVRSFPPLRRDSLVPWIKNRVACEKGKISPRAAELLAVLVGGNLWAMAGEINKLTLFAEGNVIEEEDVKRLVGYSQQANVFAMVDAILEFKVQTAVKALEKLLGDGASPSYLLAMLTRQVRLILRARDLKRQGLDGGQIQAKLGLVDFAWRKTQQQAAGYTIERLKEIYARLLETDLAIKTGRYEGEMALNILVIELCRGELSQPKTRA